MAFIIARAKRFSASPSISRRRANSADSILVIRWMKNRSKTIWSVQHCWLRECFYCSNGLGLPESIKFAKMCDLRVPRLTNLQINHISRKYIRPPVGAYPEFQRHSRNEPCIFSHPWIKPSFQFDARFLYSRCKIAFFLQRQVTMLRASERESPSESRRHNREQRVFPLFQPVRNSNLITVIIHAGNRL